MFDRRREHRRPRLPINLAGPHYVIMPLGQAWQVAAHQPNAPSQFIRATSLAEASRLARPFADAGLTGIITEVEP